MQRRGGIRKSAAAGASAKGIAATIPFVIWITGLPGSGKSTVADALKTQLPDAIILRMDDLRRMVTPEPAYTEQERDILYRAIVYLARTLYMNGHRVIIDATAHRRHWRALARETIDDYLEVYLRCPMETCRLREAERKNAHGAPRDIYRKAAEGWPVPGINVPYEEPLEPELTVDTDACGIDEGIHRVLQVLRRNNLI